MSRWRAPVLSLLVAAGCSASPERAGEARRSDEASSAAPAGREPAPAEVAPPGDAATPGDAVVSGAAVAPGDTAAPPADLAAALAAARAAGFDAGAGVIAARVAQKAPKMKLSEEQGRRAAIALTTHAGASPALRRLHERMPHSTVELARAVAERGVAAAEADAIATYLLGLVLALDFQRLERFDINHSHVTGRDWPDIDYSGEGMTWQGQQRYWAPRGVRDFKRAAHIHAYMRQAFEMPHFARVYRPRGDFADVPAP